MQAASKDNMQNLKQASNNLRDAANDAGHDAREELRDAAGRAGRKIRHAVHNTSEELSEAKEKVTSQIRSNPVRSSVIAMGLGFVLGALLRR